MTVMSVQPFQKKRDSRTKIIKVLRIGLPLLTLLILALTLVRPMLENQFNNVLFSSLEFNGDVISMQNPELTGEDGKNRRYVVRAEKASQSLGQSDSIRLENLTATLQVSETVSATLTARYGTFSKENNNLLLEENIHLITTAGHETFLSKADINLKTGIITSSAPVKILLPNQGVLESQQVRIEDNGALAEFTGSVKVRFP